MVKLMLFLLFGALAVPLLAPPQTAGDLQQYVITFEAFVGSTIALAAVLNRMIKAGGNLATFISWVSAFIVGFGAKLLELGIFATADWTFTFLLSIGGACAANITFVAVPFVKQVLEILRLRLPRAERSFD